MLATGHQHESTSRLGFGPRGAALGCGAVGFEEPASAAEEGIVGCPDPSAEWRSALADFPELDGAEGPPEVAVVMSCQWETVDRLLPGAAESATIGTSTMDRWVRDAYLADVDALVAGGADLVLWVRCPRFSESVGVEGLGPRLRASRSPERMAALNAVIDDVVAARPDRVRVVPLDEWVAPRVDDADLRPDGAHFEHERDTGAGEALAAMITQAWDEWRGASAIAGS